VLQLKLAMRDSAEIALLYWQHGNNAVFALVSAYVRILFLKSHVETLLLPMVVTYAPS